MLWIIGILRSLDREFFDLIVKIGAFSFLFIYRLKYIIFFKERLTKIYVLTKFKPGFKLNVRIQTTHVYEI